MSKQPSDAHYYIYVVVLVVIVNLLMGNNPLRSTLNQQPVTQEQRQ